MAFFKFMASLLGVSRRPQPKPIAHESSVLSKLPRPRPIALESSALSKLPRELILHIARFLPPDSASSFTLCCRPIYFTIGSQYFQALEANEHADRYKFLTLLERELPDYIACYHCKKLHPIIESRYIYSNRYYSGSIRHLPCHKADFESFMATSIHSGFSFTIFQMAMKRYRQGLDCSKLLSLLSYHTKTFYPPGHVEQCTAVAQIVAGSLFLREQRIIMVPLTQTISDPYYPLFGICSHFRFLSLRSFNRRLEIIEVGSWSKPKFYEDQDGIIPCKYCLTEFRIDFKSYGERGNAIFFTRWQEFGEGRSPLDHKWQSHVGEVNARGRLPVEFDRGSICAAFEQKEHSRFEFDSLLTPQNEEELFKESSYRWQENM